MQNAFNKIKYDIVPQDTFAGGQSFYVSLALPLEYGWYERVGMVVENNEKDLHFPLSYIKSDDNYAYFASTIMLNTSSVLPFHFICFLNGNFKNVTKDLVLTDNEIGPNDSFKMSSNFSCPSWAKGAMMYHIFIDRFKKGRREDLLPVQDRIIHRSWDEKMIIGPDHNGKWNNDFYGGDLKGIEKSLDYIKSLGVSILYLSPICKSQSNHRYDTADYLSVDPYAGCEEDLKSLCYHAHQKGFKVILDAVFNHTGNDSIYFNEFGTYPEIGAYQSEKSPYASFYRRKDDDKSFDYWWGMKNLPVCDGTSKSWQDFITGSGGVIDFWFSLGIDGLRLDVADELTDEFIELIHKAVIRNNPDGFILGEVWQNPMQMHRCYLSSGIGMHSVMNYPLVDSLIRYFKYGDTRVIFSTIDDILRQYPDDTIKTLMNFTSTHDISRAINIFSADDFNPHSEWAWNLNNDSLAFCSNYRLTKEEYLHGRNIFEAYAFFLAFFPGIFSIFYGDEVGLQGMGNLANRAPYPWGKRDKKLLQYFRYLGWIRQNETFLKDANLQMLDINEKYLMFERRLNEEKVLVSINRTGAEQEYFVPLEYQSDYEKIYTLKRSMPGYLKPYGASAIKIKK